ncbi:MAG: hypothetical protein V2I67_06630 [Thermoanaerobaculales bacterium]|nr:hypothetical protein [Thermoanaerobaculales bacterium]
MLSSAAFAVLCATLAAIGRVSVAEASWAAAAVALVLVPTGWWSPVGWRRRAAEAILVLPAWALVILADPVQRRMLLPPLLAVAVWAAVVAAWSRVREQRRVVLIAFLALGLRASTGVGLMGFEWWSIGLAFAAGAAAASAGTRIGGRDLGGILAFLTAALPLQTLPMVAVWLVLAASIVWRFGDPLARRQRGLGWTPGAIGVSALGLSVAAWGGIQASGLFPQSGLWTVAAVLAALVAARFVPPGVAGAIWFLVALTVGPSLAPAPEGRGFVLDGEPAEVVLPAGTGAPYLLDLRLDGTTRLAAGTVVAELRVGSDVMALTTPEHALHRHPDGPGAPNAVRRPQGLGHEARWRQAARTVIEVPAGTAPRLTRHRAVPAETTVVLEVVGPSRPTPPRSRDLGWWMVVAAAAVAVVQLTSGTLRIPFAVTPWTVLIVGNLAARAWVEPLRLLAERHAVDLAIAALLTAWLPAAVAWLRQRRTFVTVAALLVPLAAATPFLTPPLYGDEPFHLRVMDSIFNDGDVSLANNLDVGTHPGEVVFDRAGDLLHSPVLGILLLPGFAVAGRMGALILLAMASSAGLALVARRARRLGVPESRLRGLVLVLAATYPAAVFATQLWVEMVGVLAVAGALLAVAGGRGGRWAALGWAVLATAVKTRLALLVFPVAAAAVWTRRRGRIAGVLALVSAAAVGAAVGWITMGHPFGIYRRLGDLLPEDPGLALRVVGGLMFDPSGGLCFAAPLWIVALVGAGALWRRGGPGERGLLVGCGLTVLALLHSVEWYGGGSPPARYLVPMLPAVALAGGLILREPRRWRRLAELVLTPSLAVWWVLVTRPHYSINPGDGGWWLSDALARSYLADTAWLVPSFLVPRTATWAVPAAVVLLASVVVVAVRWRPATARRIVAAGAAIWLVCAAILAAAVTLRTDRVVEAEAPQVRRFGGSPHPAEGTVSRFFHRRGWMMRGGDRVVVPLHLPEGATVSLEGWLLGTAMQGARLDLRWDDGETVPRRVEGGLRAGRLKVHPPPGSGRHRLSVTVAARARGAVVLDRVIVEQGP